MRDKSKILVPLTEECPEFADGDYLAYYRQRYMGWWHMLREVEKLPAGDAALDVGPYFGDMSVALAKLGYRVSTIDYAQKFPKHLQERYQLEFAVGNVELDPLPYPDNQFDLVIFSETLEHLNYSPLKPLQEFHRVLKPGGHLIITTPNVSAWRERWVSVIGRTIYPPLETYLADPLWYKGVPFCDRHNRLYTMAELVRLCRMAEFEITRTSYVACRTLPNSFGKRISRVFSRLKDIYPRVRKTLQVVVQKPRVASS